MTTVMPGMCRHCRCTEDRACRLSDGDTCSWTDRTRLVCTNPLCVKAEQERLRKIEAARPKRLSSAEVSNAIRHGNRKRKQRAA